MPTLKKILALALIYLTPYHAMAADVSANFQSFKVQIAPTIATTSVSDGANAWQAVETSAFHDTNSATTESECFFEDTAFAAELEASGVELTATYTVCSSTCSETTVSACDLQTYVAAGSTVGSCEVHTMCRDCQTIQVNDCSVNDYLNDGWSLGDCSCSGGGGSGGSNRDLTKIAMYPTGSTFEDTQTVRVYSNLSNATVYYTLDGSDPKTNGTRSDGAATLNLTADTTVTAVALANGEYSEVISYFFDFIEPVEAEGEICYEGETLTLTVSEIAEYLELGAVAGACAEEVTPETSPEEEVTEEVIVIAPQEPTTESTIPDTSPIRQNEESKVRQLVPLIPAKEPIEDPLRPAADELGEVGESIKDEGGLFTGPIPICKKDLQWCEEAGYNLEKKQKNMIVIYALEGTILCLFIFILLFAFLVAHHKRDVEKIMRRLNKLEHDVDELQHPKKRKTKK